jgi:hypothetical protein
LRSIASIIGIATPPPPKTRCDRAAEHWQFLFEHGRAGEAEAYAAMIGPDNLPPAEIFDAVETRMRDDRAEETAA